MRLLIAAGLVAGSVLAAPAATAAGGGGESACDKVAAWYDRMITDRWWQCPTR